MEVLAPNLGMSTVIKDSLSNIFNSGYKLCFYGAVFCAHAVGWFTMIPGASKSIVEIGVPYGKGAFINLLGYEPTSYVSQETALSLAEKAYLNSQLYELLDHKGEIEQIEYKEVIGVGVTGALKTTYEKKGEHQAYICLMGDISYIYHLKFKKDLRMREDEDFITSDIIIQLISNYIDGKPEISSLVNTYLTNEDEIKLIKQFAIDDYMLDNVENQKIKNIINMANGKVYYNLNLKSYIVLSGAFNPIHDGHIELIKSAAQKLGWDKSRIIFELSISNADKGLVDKNVYKKRVEAINSKGYNAMITKIPYFGDKNFYLTNGYFLLGADTFKRLLDKKYYENSYEFMIAKLSEFRKKNNKLIVASRYDSANGKLSTLRDFTIPEILTDFVIELDFRMDISSSEIRNQEQIIKKE